MLISFTFFIGFLQKKFWNRIEFPKFSIHAIYFSILVYFLLDFYQIINFCITISLASLLASLSFRDLQVIIWDWTNIRSSKHINLDSNLIRFISVHPLSLNHCLQTHFSLGHKTNICLHHISKLGLKWTICLPS